MMLMSVCLLVLNLIKIYQLHINNIKKEKKVIKLNKLSIF